MGTLMPDQSCHGTLAWSSGILTWSCLHILMQNHQPLEACIHAHQSGWCLHQGTMPAFKGLAMPCLQVLHSPGEVVTYVAVTACAFLMFSLPFCTLHVLHSPGGRS